MTDATILFADVTFSTEGMLVITTLVAALAGTVAMLFRHLMTAKDAQHASTAAQKDAALAELTSAKKSLTDIAQEAIKSAIETANHYRAKEGKAPIIPAAAVISESHSPSTEKQRETANIATMRASMAQLKLMTGQAPRVEPEQAVEPAPPATVLFSPVTAGEVKILREEIAKAPDVIAERVAEKVVERIKDGGEGGK